MRPIVAAFLVLCLASCGSGPRLYDGFGNYTREIQTRVPATQLWFDQGMQLLYGFNHDEAIRSFAHAAKLDDRSAIAWWGKSYAHGLHINNPEMSEEQSQLAYEAAQEALARIEHARPVERALIHAVSKRYAWPVPNDRKPLDVAYAAAMGDAWREFGDDPDVGALYAEALMTLQPWDYWTPDGAPKGRIEEIVQVLERVLAMRPDHPGANHFYIHALEASNTPERALVAADRLCSLVPGAGHLVHMPSHIYARVGRWADAADANERAVAVDRAYFARAPEPDFYSLYFIHNLHFLAYAAMMEGRFEVARQAAEDLVSDIPPSFVSSFPQFADGFLQIGIHVLIRFGRWHEILELPEPPEVRRISRAMRHYARGVALSALSRTAEARAERDLFEAAVRLVPEDWLVGLNPAADVFEVARRMLDGELAYREGRLDAAFSALREGVELEEGLAYDEPPGWMQPVRHALGALLMGADRADEAIEVYRADLARHPNNGWGLLGLRRALSKRSKFAEAAAVSVQLEAAWTRADVEPTSSCYCEPGNR